MIAEPNSEYSEHDHYCMERALALAAHAMESDEVPVGAVISYQNIIIGTGHNQPIRNCDPSCHAEVQAIRAAARTQRNYRLPDCTLYVTLEPCVMCCGLLIHARIARLVFAALEYKTGAVMSRHRLLDDTPIHYQHGLMNQQSTALLQSFFRQKRMRKATC